MNRKGRKEGKGDFSGWMQRFNPPRFRLILSSRRKRSSRSVSRRQPASSYSRELIVRATTLPSPAPFGVFSPSVFLFITSHHSQLRTLPETEDRATSRPSRNVLLSLTQLVYLRHGSKLESVSKSTSNALFLFLSLLDSIRFFFFFILFADAREGEKWKARGCCMSSVWNEYL